MVTPNFYGSLVSNGTSRLSVFMLCACSCITPCAWCAWCAWCAVVAGLTHGAGIIPGANIGKTGALFEQGTRLLGRDLAGKDVVNPTGMLFSFVMMLRHMQLPSFADRIEVAVSSTLAVRKAHTPHSVSCALLLPMSMTPCLLPLHVCAQERKVLTQDLGGSASTTEFVDAVIAKL